MSLPEDDIAFVDEYASRSDAASRSAVIHAAIESLRMTELEGEYAEAFEEWAGSEDAELWDPAAGDGLTDAPR